MQRSARRRSIDARVGLLGRTRRCARDEFGTAWHVCSIRVRIARGDVRDAPRMR
jgi:hypothetical protein